MSAITITIEDKKYLPQEVQGRFAALFVTRDLLHEAQGKELEAFERIIASAKKAEQVFPPMNPAPSQADIKPLYASFLTLPACDASLFTDLRVISAALLVAGTVLLAVSLIFGFGAIGIALGALLLTGGVGIGGYAFCTAVADAYDKVGQSDAIENNI